MHGRGQEMVKESKKGEGEDKRGWWGQEREQWRRQRGQRGWGGVEGAKGRVQGSVRKGVRDGNGE